MAVLHAADPRLVGAGRIPMNYAGLCVTLNFTFLTGASHAEGDGAAGAWQAARGQGRVPSGSGGSGARLSGDAADRAAARCPGIAWPGAGPRADSAVGAVLYGALFPGATIAGRQGRGAQKAAAVLPTWLSVAPSITDGALIAPPQDGPKTAPQDRPKTAPRQARDGASDFTFPVTGPCRASARRRLPHGCFAPRPRPRCGKAGRRHRGCAGPVAGRLQQGLRSPPLRDWSSRP